MLKVRESNAKSVLNRSKIYDYCVNPYTGCQVGCAYCYARLFMKRFSGHKEPWGEFVDVKVNAPEILKRQVQKAKRGIVWISSVCDPYQPLEAKYQLTRRCLKELATVQFPVRIQTKSKLALRDLDLFLEFREIEVGFTITTDDEKTAKLFEPEASSIMDRIEALGRIHERGIRTFAFIGPLLPGNPEMVVARLDGIVDEVVIDRMNYMGPIKKFYHRHELEEAATDVFFHECRRKLVKELTRRKMEHRLLF